MAKQRPIKISMIGAGGWQFPLRLARDILSFPALQGCEIALFDINPEGAARTASHVRSIVDEYGLAADVHTVDDRESAFLESDFVISMFWIGREAYEHDILIPRSFGVDQSIGDTLGPGGIFQGLRSVSVLTEMAGEMKRLCPEALLIQYANPMSINCWAATDLGITTVGLCHSVQHTSAMLANELQVPYDEIVFDCAGINHTSWFTTFRHGRRDLVPVIYETMIERHLGPEAVGGISDDPYEGHNEKVRSELMRLTGYFPTESSHHSSEYWSWFRRTEQEARNYLGEDWRWFGPEKLKARDADERDDEVLAEIQSNGLTPSEEYGAYIIDSVVTGTPRLIYGNVPNAGSIDNLPPDALIEVACYVGAHGVRPLRYGSLPAECAALNIAQVNVQRLAVRAALAGDIRSLYAAVALDPLTSATLTLPEVYEMVDQMIEAEAEWLPQFERRTRQE